MSVTAVSPADEPRFVEFTDVSLIDGSLGDFYLIEGADYDAKQKVYLRVDAKFKDLIEPELYALNAEQPASFCVGLDPRRNQPNHFRIDLNHYRARAAGEVQEEAAWNDDFRPVEATSSVMGQVKSITATVPIEVWSILREGHQRNRERYSRFGDYLSAWVCRSASPFDLG